MNILRFTLLGLLCVLGHGLADSINAGSERESSQLIQSEVRHGGHYNNWHGSFPSTTNVNLSPGDTRVISSRYMRPSRRGSKKTWNIQSPGSTIQAECTIRLRRGCFYSSLSINGQRFCSGYQQLETITAENSLQIVFESRLRKQYFKCFITTVPTTTTTTASPNNALDWTYSGANGPDQWSATYPTCGGSNQSPIDIDTSSTIGPFPWKELGLHDYDTADQTLSLMNSARAAVLTVPEGPYIMGGNLPLNEQFFLTGVFFHWGSEHSIDGQFFSGEAQFVHYNSKYGDVNSAFGAADGIVVLTSFLQESSTANQELDPLILGLRNIQMPGSSTPVTSLNLTSLLPETFNDFYKYEGSQTIPGCLENVTWLITLDPIDISTAQMAEFRTLRDETGSLITSNNRPTQQLNGRNVSEGQVDPSWSHHGPDGQEFWTSEISDTCGGDRQSPINIDTSTVVVTNDAPIVTTNFDVVPSTLLINNNDHGAQLLPTFDTMPTIIGGPWDTPHEFFHYHFHWGSPTTAGSEHTIDGKRYAGEIHMIVFNQSLGGFGPAFMTDKGVYEVTIFMELSEDDNPNFDPVIAGLENIKLSLSTAEITPFPMENLLPSNLQNYYYYDGSFTAPLPTCSELADFLVFAEPIPISRNQIQKFYDLEDAAGNKIIDNFRDLQPLNGRPIFGSQ